MPNAAYIPAVMSAIDTPARTPRPPGSPGDADHPALRLHDEVEARRDLRYGPSWPNPEIEQ